MVYPFETAAYSTNAGQVSAPVKTDYGFHVIKVTDKIPALGDFTVAHLFLSVPKGATSADSLRIKDPDRFQYTNSCRTGAKFEDLVKTIFRRQRLCRKRWCPSQAHC